MMNYDDVGIDPFAGIRGRVPIQNTLTPVQTLQTAPPISLAEHRSFIQSLRPTLSLKDAAVFHGIPPINLNNGHHMSVICYRPKKEKPDAGWPTVFYIPGTAFIDEEFAYTDAICRYLAHDSGAQILVLRPRLSPEVVFPTPLEECITAFDELMNLTEPYLEIAKDQIILSGYSSGANLAASLGIRLKNRVLNPPICLQLLISPILDFSSAYAFAHENALGPGLDYKEFYDSAVISPGSLRLMFKQLLHRLEDTSPEGVAKYLQQTTSLTPFNLKQEEFKGLPETILMSGDRKDVFMKDSVEFERRLIAQGVKVKRVRFAKVSHAMIWKHEHILDEMAMFIRKALVQERFMRNPSELTNERNQFRLADHYSVNSDDLRSSLLDELESPGTLSSSSKEGFYFINSGTSSATINSSLSSGDLTPLRLPTAFIESSNHHDQPIFNLTHSALSGDGSLTGAFQKHRGASGGTNTSGYTPLLFSLNAQSLEDHSVSSTSDNSSLSRQGSNREAQVHFVQPPHLNLNDHTDAHVFKSPHTLDNQYSVTRKSSQKDPINHSSSTDALATKLGPRGSLTKTFSLDGVMNNLSGVSKPKVVTVSKRGRNVEIASTKAELPKQGYVLPLPKPRI